MPGISTPAPAVVQGRVHGGQPAVQGATIQLYAVNTSSYGAPATPLIGSTVKTNNFGGFIITGLYSCPSATAQVYIVATGGNPGLAPLTDNSAIAMMSALGDCGNLSSSTFIDIDEVSTVAAVFALAPFMNTGAGANIGTSSTNAQGMANAFDTATSLLATTATGLSPGSSVPSGATVPSDEINTLADIISICINSDSPGSAGCTSLFTATTSSLITPNNTIDALLSVALSPANNAAAIFALLPASPPFTPVLGAAPPDWTMAVTYTGGALNNPQGIAADGSGNVWVTNASSLGPVVEYSPLGQVVGSYNPGNNINFAWAIAIDTIGNAWVANTGQNNIVGLSSTGTLISGTPYSGSGLANDMAIAVDGSNNLWAVNDNAPFCCDDGSVSKFASGTGSGPFTGGGLAGTNPFGDSPNAVAVDHSGNVWTANYGGDVCCGAVTELDNAGNAVSPSSGYIVGGVRFANPQGIAIGSSGTVWTANGNASLSELDNTGAAISGSGGYTGGGLNNPLGIAIDGLGNVWVTNHNGNSLSEFDNGGNPISPSSPAGYGSGALLGNPWGIAIDGSGNVWTVNSFNNTLTEFVGIAAPTVTPLAAQAANDTFGTRP